ncbi:dephospho-CoA kinase [Vibrio sp. HA2012]|uniref:dephospho-CoA kinase n=1 Tax=Vibrio sp. HA2012 TaxID=1971595 RepID=UPI000C2C89E9|nr:dephospho-CoA kinase [Vibrio sp. HA2012]PJC86384.1 dephospho-CoA kinase [Vibrio sp. HA2012]
MPLIIGVTGGIASGKTTVANLFRDHFAIDIIDADIIAREVVAPGTPGLDAIRTHFGAEILTAEGCLDRPKLRHKIFSDKMAKHWLNTLLHPLIRSEMQQALSRVTSPYALLVVPLLVENQLQSMTNRILVVDVSETTQITRTMHRDHVSREQAESILAAQASRSERLKYADDIIMTDDYDRLLPQVSQLHRKYLDLSRTGCNDMQANSTGRTERPPE